MYWQVAYCVPAYLLAGLHYPDIGDLTSFYLYIGDDDNFDDCDNFGDFEDFGNFGDFDDHDDNDDYDDDFDFFEHVYDVGWSGYMLLYLACLRALTVCLATVSSSRC